MCQCCIHRSRQLSVEDRPRICVLKTCIQFIPGSSKKAFRDPLKELRSSFEGALEFLFRRASGLFYLEVGVVPQVLRLLLNSPLGAMGPYNKSYIGHTLRGTVWKVAPRASNNLAMRAHVWLQLHRLKDETCGGFTLVSDNYLCALC